MGGETNGNESFSVTAALLSISAVIWNKIEVEKTELGSGHLDVSLDSLSEHFFDSSVCFYQSNLLQYFL